MAARISRLITKRERIAATDAECLRQAMLDCPVDLPDWLKSRLIAEIDGATAARNRRTFVMLSAADNAAVVDWLAKNSKRVTTALRLWAKLFENLRTDTGEITLTRDELAELVGEAPKNISEIMGELESISAISRKRERVAGMRGPGMVRYFMNPRVATHLAGKARDKAQAKAPPLLTVMEGGKPPS